VLTIILLDKLVILLVLILLLGKSIIIKLFLVNTIDDLEIILNFLLLTKGYGILLTSFVVFSGVDLIIFLLALSENLIALDEVGPN